MHFWLCLMIWTMKSLNLVNGCFEASLLLYALQFIVSFWERQVMLIDFVAYICLCLYFWYSIRFIILFIKNRAYADCCFIKASMSFEVVKQLLLFFLVHQISNTFFTSIAIKLFAKPLMLMVLYDIIRFLIFQMHSPQMELLQTQENPCLWRQ